MPRCFQLNKNGPDGALHPSQMILAEAVLSGTPNERSASFLNVDGVFDVGVFETDAYEERIDGSPIHEIMVILSGHVRVEPDDAPAFVIGPGDVVCMERGWRGFWRQSETVRKFTVIYES
jgi:uncharacterized cupin superfamily protein